MRRVKDQKVRFVNLAGMGGWSSSATVETLRARQRNKGLGQVTICHYSDWVPIMECRLTGGQAGEAYEKCRTQGEVSRALGGIKLSLRTAENILSEGVSDQ